MPSLRPVLVSLLLVATTGTAGIAVEEGLPPVDPAIAAMTPDQKVEARQKAMKEDNRLLRQARNATGDAAVAAATTVLQNFVNFPALFEDSATNTSLSKTSSDVWKEFDKFSALFTQGQQQAADMLAAARAGDSGGYTASLRALAQTCFECHQSYRID